MSNTLDEILDNLAYEMGPHADEFKSEQVTAAKQAILQWANDREEAAYNKGKVEEAKKCIWPYELHKEVLGEDPTPPKPFAIPQNGCHLHPTYVIGCGQCKERYPDYEPQPKETL